MNPIFSCGSRITSNEVKPCSMEWLEKVLNDPKTLELTEKFQATGDDAYKKQIPFICPQASFANGIRKEENAVATGLVGLDLDNHHYESELNADEIWQQLIRPRLDGHLCDVLMVYRTVSGKGMRVIARRTPGMSILENQKHLFALISQGQLDERLLDTSCHDLARAFILCPAKDVFYLDKEQLFGDAAWTNLPATVHEPVVRLVVPAGESTEQVNLDEAVNEAMNPACNPLISADGTCYQNVPYLEIIQEICLSQLRIRGIMPEKGSRNNKLYQLSILLSHICKDQQHVISLLPNWGLPQKEVESTVASAWNKHLTEKMPVALQDLINRLSGEEVDQLLPPELPKVLPLFVKTVLRPYPAYLHPALAITMLPAVGALATNVRFYLNGYEEHHLSFQTCLVSLQAWGKSTMVKLSDRLMKPLLEQDDKNRELIRQWKEKNKALGDNKDKAPNPHHSIRVVTPKCSSSQFFELMHDARGKHLYSCIPELDSVGTSTWALTNDLRRLAFDGERGGQDTKSDNSTSFNDPIFYNYTASGTPDAVFLKHYKNVSSGDVSRVSFTTLPDRRGMEQEYIDIYIEKEEEIIDEVLQTLMQLGEDATDHKWFVDAKKVQKCMDKWKKSKNELYLRTQDEAVDTFMRRDAVMGARAMVAAMLMEGGKLTKAAINYGLYVAESSLYYHLRFFGEKERAAKQANLALLNGSPVTARLQHNPIFDSLPDTFKATDLKAAQVAKGLKGEGYRMDIKRYLQRGWIIQLEGGLYAKAKAV